MYLSKPIYIRVQLELNPEELKVVLEFNLKFLKFSRLLRFLNIQFLKELMLLHKHKVESLLNQDLFRVLPIDLDLGRFQVDLVQLLRARTQKYQLNRFPDNRFQINKALLLTDNSLIDRHLQNSQK